MSMRKSIPFVDLSRAHAAYKQEIMDAMSSVIDRSAFVLGPEVERFEKSFAKYIGVEHAVGVGSGLDALKIALQACGVGPGHEVVTAANTFIATAMAISACGATPVLADVDERTYNLDPKALRAKITHRTRAIIPVHLYGQVAEMDEICKIAQDNDLKIIEDCAQAHGASYHGRKAGTFGEAACFSFYPSKNLGSFGEGGAIVMNDRSVAERARMYRNVGQKEKYIHEVLGHNSRLHTLQAAVLEIKLRHLDAENESRRQAAALYRKYLNDVAEIHLPHELCIRKHVYHLYAIRLNSGAEREGLRDHLGKNGVQTGIHYPVPIHLQRCYSALGQGRGSFPVTERLSEEILSLPIFPGMTEEEVSTVAHHIKGYFAAVKGRRTGLAPVA